jgi:hypothetical protein
MSQPSFRVRHHNPAAREIKCQHRLPGLCEFAQPLGPLRTVEGRPTRTSPASAMLRHCPEWQDRS